MSVRALSSAAIKGNRRIILALRIGHRRLDGQSARAASTLLNFPYVDGSKRFS